MQRRIFMQGLNIVESMMFKQWYARKDNISKSISSCKQMTKAALEIPRHFKDEYAVVLHNEY